jgi:hypothetical protein
MEGNQMFIIFGPKRHKGLAKPEKPPAAEGKQASEGGKKPEGGEQ